MQCAVGCCHVMRVWRAVVPDHHLFSVYECVVRHVFSHVFTVQPLSRSTLFRKSVAISHGGVSMVARALNGRPVSLQPSDSKKTHRGRRKFGIQTKREQRSKWYFPGSFAFAWRARNHGTTRCILDHPASDGNVRTNAAERRSCRTSETTPGSPQERWSDVGGTIGPSGSDCDNRYVSSWWD